jgi:hypothetical protein
MKDINFEKGVYLGRRYRRFDCRLGDLLRINGPLSVDPLGDFWQCMMVEKAVNGVDNRPGFAFQGLDGRRDDVVAVAQLNTCRKSTCMKGRVVQDTSRCVGRGVHQQNVLVEERS